MNLYVFSQILYPNFFLNKQVRKVINNNLFTKIKNTLQNVFKTQMKQISQRYYGEFDIFCFIKLLFLKGYFDFGN